MALSLVVTSAFPGYPRGTIITDPGTIDLIRTGDYANQVVMVSDTVIPPPDPPEGTPLPGGGVSMADFLALKSSYTALSASDAQQQQALATLLAVNSSQTQDLTALGQQVMTLNSTVQVLAAKIDNPNGGTPIPPNLADDKPLAEADGIMIETASGKLLVGDIR